MSSCKARVNTSCRALGAEWPEHRSSNRAHARVRTAVVAVVVPGQGALPVAVVPVVPELTGPQRGDERRREQARAQRRGDDHLDVHLSRTARTAAPELAGSDRCLALLAYKEQCAIANEVSSARETAGKLRSQRWCRRRGGAQLYMLSMGPGAHRRPAPQQAAAASLPLLTSPRRCLYRHPRRWRSSRA